MIIREFHSFVRIVLAKQVKNIRHTTVSDIFKRKISYSPVMAHSKWDYVKKFELDDTLLPNSFAVARIDGRGKLSIDWPSYTQMNGVDLVVEYVYQINYMAFSII